MQPILFDGSEESAAKIAATFDDANIGRGEGGKIVMISFGRTDTGGCVSGIVPGMSVWEGDDGDVWFQSEYRSGRMPRYTFGTAEAILVKNAS